ncbi:hypothetical protein BHM03_00004011, partial [Ensete ventricosum]
SVVRPLAPPVCLAGYLRWVGHVGGPAVRGARTADLTQVRSAPPNCKRMPHCKDSKHGGRVRRVSDYSSPECPYPCLPPPTSVMNYPPPPPSEPAWGYPPPPSGYLPYYSSPYYTLPAPPPPDPILPYFPFYYKRPPPPPRSSSGSAIARSGAIWVPLFTALLPLIFW